MTGRRSESKAAYWSAHIENWLVSGLSQAGYCSKNGIHVKNFRRWRKIFDQQEGGSTSSPASAKGAETAPFIPVSIMPDLGESVDLDRADQRHDAGIRLQVGRYRVDLAIGFDAGTLRHLLTTLDGMK